jgi:hypothetical protein
MQGPNPTEPELFNIHYRKSLKLCYVTINTSPFIELLELLEPPNIVTKISKQIL